MKREYHSDKSKYVEHYRERADGEKISFLFHEDTLTDEAESEAIQERLDRVMATMDAVLSIEFEPDRDVEEDGPRKLTGFTRLRDDTLTAVTIDEVCERLLDEGADPAEVSKVHSSRMQPQKLDNPDAKYALGVTNPDKTEAWLVLYRFGKGAPMVKESPLDESGPDWRPRWVSVHGPYPISTKADLMEINRISGELTHSED